MDDERDLRERFNRAAEQMPVKPVSYEHVVGRGRAARRRTMTLQGAFAAGVVAAVAILWPGAPVREADPLPPIGNGAETSMESGIVPPVRRPRAVDAVVRWIDAIAEGDARTAWDLLGPVSKDASGGYDAFADESAGWKDGIGKWAGLPGVQYAMTTIASSGEGSLEVISLYRAEGEAAALMVRDLRGGALVEHLPSDASAGVDLLSPDAPPAPISMDEPPAGSAERMERPAFEAEVTSTALNVRFVIADLPGFDKTVQIARGTARYPVVRWAPARRVPAGLHVVVAIVEHPKGALAASAARFDVP